MLKKGIHGIGILLTVLLILSVMSATVYGQVNSLYTTFGLTSFVPSWVSILGATDSWLLSGISNPYGASAIEWPAYSTTGGFFGVPVYGGSPGLASFAWTGIHDFGSYGFGTYGAPGTGAFGGFGSPSVSSIPWRPYGSFGITSMGPSWSASLLGMPSWIMTGIASPWFNPNLY